MGFQGLVHPELDISISSIFNAFNVHHLSMAFFFGILGSSFCFIIIQYTIRLSKEKQRVRILETMLPICSYCKKIRDDSDSENGKGIWYDADHYLSKKTNTAFTHGICPECYSKVIEEIENEI